MRNIVKLFAVLLLLVSLIRFAGSRAGRATIGWLYLFTLYAVYTPIEAVNDILEDRAEKREKEAKKITDEKNWNLTLAALAEQYCPSGYHDLCQQLLGNEFGRIPDFFLAGAVKELEAKPLPDEPCTYACRGFCPVLSAAYPPLPEPENWLFHLHSGRRRSVV